jgi:hypothetical protein
MDKESIIDVIIEIGDLLQSAKWEKEREEMDESNEADRRDVGYPVGTTLFAFSYDGGVEEVEVVDKQKVKCGRQVRYCVESDLFAESPIEAIRKEVASWRKNGELQVEEDISHFEHDVEYYEERAEWAKMAIAAIKDITST